MPLNFPALIITLACWLLMLPPTAPTVHKTTALKCYGYTPCDACTNCSACKYCNAGGTCGVCEKPKPKKPNQLYTPPASSARCKAITKKGTRCSRNASSGGYCWQHAK